MQQDDFGIEAIWGLCISLCGFGRWVQLCVLAEYLRSYSYTRIFFILYSCIIMHYGFFFLHTQELFEPVACI